MSSLTHCWQVSLLDLFFASSTALVVREMCCVYFISWEGSDSISGSFRCWQEIDTHRWYCQFQILALNGPSSSLLLSSLVILTPVAQGLTFPEIPRKNKDKLLASTS